MKENEKKWKLVNYREIISTVYMAVITVIICYFASRIYKTDEEIWPRERYIIVATMVICFWMVLVKLVADRKKDLRKKMLMYHFILLTPLILMAFPIDYYEFRPLYLIPMIVVLLSDLSLGLLSGIAITISTYIMIFTNLEEFMYLALIIMVFGCLSAAQINNLKRFFVSTAVFWAVTFYLCGIYRYFALDNTYETFQYKFAAVGLMVAAASSIVIFFVKYWIFFIRIRTFADEKSMPLMDMKEKSISLYYHSIEVGNLAKAAAAAVKADIPLACAGGYLHDIGKLHNAKDVKESLKAANEYGLPKNIKAIIVECSGKYRKPMTKEAAIVMLADSVVTSVEYLRETKKEVSEDTILDHAFATRVNSGILSDSGLSLEELYIIKKIFAEKYH